MKRRTILSGTVLATLAAAAGGGEGQTYRLYEGITVYVNNSAGKDFSLALDVRDLNLYESGPREILFKVYAPDGKVLVREWIPDDGIAARGFLPRLGGWDHEMWYYLLCYSRGSEPMFRWSCFSDPKYLAAMPKRSFVREIQGGGKGVYRILLVGYRDHYVTLKLDPDLPCAVGGHTTWLHGHGDMFRKSFIYVPKGTTGIHFALIEFDPPQTRRFKLSTPDGKPLFDGTAEAGYVERSIPFEKPGQYDDDLLTLEVSSGAGDFMIHGVLQRADPSSYGGMGSHFVLAPDAKTAKAVRGGSIYHDGKVYWHGFQVRFHDWLKTLKDDDFVVKDDKGAEVPLKPVRATFANVSRYAGLPQRPNYFELNGPHFQPPISDSIMHDYPAHKNRAALNVALHDLHDGFAQVCTGDHRGQAGWVSLSYSFGTYAFHYWRPAWRVLQQSDAPQEVKEILREALLVGGDRIAAGIGIERCNGNAFAHIPMALKYCSEATQDTIQKEVYKTFLDRFRTEGWGEGCGIGPSGDCQEHFAHDNHYGSYVLASFLAPIADFDDPDFRAMRDRIRTLYSFIWCRGADANPWSSRTAHSFAEEQWRGNDLAWMGDPGPDVTVNVNGGSEWFAARRKGYYIVTYHGRLCPAWLVNGFYGQIGFGGGILCQLTVPGKGVVLYSTLNGYYGQGMELGNWRNFHIHSIVGEMADGRPLVAAVSEHKNAALTGQIVESSGEVRDRPVRVTRRYTFEPDAIVCEASLGESGYTPALTLWSGPRRAALAMIKEAYEMIPFAPGATVTLTGAGGKDLGALAPEPVKEVSVITVTAKGCGVRIELAKPSTVLRGTANTVLVQLTDKPTPAPEISVRYRLAPF